MEEKLDKKRFYEQLKNTGRYSPIYVRMRINEESNYIISLSENRITTNRYDFSTEFCLQILDDTKRNTPRHTVKEIYFELVQENIFSDYQLYKFINKKIQEILEGQYE